MITHTHTQSNIKLKSKGTDIVYEVNEKVRLHEMKQGLWSFFKTPYGDRETYTVYRGQLIVRNTVQFTGGSPSRRTMVYIYCVASNEGKCEMPDTFHVGQSSSIYQAKKLIDEILESGEF